MKNLTTVTESLLSEKEWISLESEELFNNAIKTEVEKLQEEINNWDEDNNPEFTTEELEEKIEWLRNLDFSVGLLNSEILPQSIRDYIEL